MRSEPKPEIESEEQKLIQLLKQGEAGKEEAMKCLTVWLMKQERMAENGEPYAYVEFNLRRARLYLAAGLIEEAMENFNDAAILADNLGMEDSYQRILKERNASRNGLK